MDQIDTVVVGAGVVGLAVAAALARAGHEVLVLEVAESIGTGTSSRNSEVIHAGIYYPQDSLKARLCVEGNRRLYTYCARHGVNYRRCGKLIVATRQDQLTALHSIQARAQANGTEPLQALDANQVRALEPQLRCHAALLSPATGIVDSHGLMLALQGELEDCGGQVVLRTEVARVESAGLGMCLTTADGTRLGVRQLVNSAGLHAQALALRIAGLEPRHVPPAYFAKGHYFALQGACPFSRLIYPVPEDAGLGVHLTLDLAGQAKFGPDVLWVTDPYDLSVDPSRAAGFYDEVRRYWPGLRDGALLPAYAGIRPKLQSPGEAARDFMVQGPASHGVPGLVNLFGIESPGLTSALALAEHVIDVLQGHH